MALDSAFVRDAFANAVKGFLETTQLIADDQWEEHATGEWSVIELFSHTARGMMLVVDYLDVGVDPGTVAEVDSAVEYFRIALDITGVHQQISERAVAAVNEYGTEPLERIREAALVVLARVAATSDDQVIAVRGSTIRLIDYLETRIVELVLHTLDLQLACGMNLSAATSGLAVTNDVLLNLTDRANPVAVALVLAGRVSPLRCSVLD